VREVILVAATMSLATVVHLLGHTISGLLLGLRVNSFNLFYGRPLGTIHFRTFPIHLGWIPTGGTVDFGESLNIATFPVKVIVILSGPLALLITSAACIRYDRAGIALLSGFIQLFQGALSPLSTGHALIENYFHQHGASVQDAYGVLAAKLSAFNLLPIFPLNGGQIIIRSITSRTDSGWIIWVGSVGVILTFAIALSWLIALSAYFLGA
jgi:hypothetical protein